MDKNQILFTEIERRIKDITEEMDFYYKKIDKLDAICEELERLLSFAEEDDDYIEKLEFDEVFEEDDEELNGLKKDYSEVRGSFDEFKKQFDSMINRGEAFCECCGEKVVKESDGYYYCGVCDYEHYIGEDIDEDDYTPDLFRDELDHCDSCDDCDCDNCEFNDDDYDNEDEYDEEFCIICDSKMEYGVDNDGDEYYDCPNCGKREYL